MNNLQVFNYQDQQVRSVNDDRAPYFVAAEFWTLAIHRTRSREATTADQRSGAQDVDSRAGLSKPTEEA